MLELNMYTLEIPMVTATSLKFTLQVRGLPVVMIKKTSMVAFHIFTTILFVLFFSYSLGVP
jgi:hypothetical protein